MHDTCHWSGWRRRVSHSTRSWTIPWAWPTAYLEQAGIARIRSQFALAHARLEEAAARLPGTGQQLEARPVLYRMGARCHRRGAVRTSPYVALGEPAALPGLGRSQRIGWVRYLLARLLFV